MRKLSLFLLLLFLPLLVILPASAQKVPGAACPLVYASSDITSSGALKIIAKATTGTTPVYINGVAQANPAGPSIRICSIKVHVVQPATPGAYGLVTGTGTNCGTGQANLTPQFTGTASVTEDWTQYYGDNAAIVAPAATDVCFKLGAAVTHSQVLITYAIL